MNFKEATALLNKIELLAHFFNPINKKTAIDTVKQTASEHIFKMAQVAHQCANMKIDEISTRAPVKMALKSAGIGVLFVGGAVAAKFVLLPAALSMIHAAISAIAIALSILFTNWMSEKETEPKPAQKASAPAAVLPKKVKETKPQAESLAPSGTQMADEFTKNEAKPTALSGKQLADEFAKQKTPITEARSLAPSGTQMADEFTKKEAKSTAPSGKQLADEFVQQTSKPKVEERKVPLIVQEFADFEKAIFNAAFRTRNEEQLMNEFSKYYKSLVEKQYSQEILIAFGDLTQSMLRNQIDRNPRSWHNALMNFSISLFNLPALMQPPKL